MSLRRSGRNIVLGSGTVTTTTFGGSWKGTRLVFSTAQFFHPGETVAIGQPLVDMGTIVHGSGTTWVVAQSFGTNYTNSTWRRTDPGTGRNRGASNSESVIVPHALHYLYVSPLDNAGNPDWYTYYDTVAPVRGVHPYTRDKWSGRSWLSRDALYSTEDNGWFVADLATRVADLDALPPVLTK